MVSTITGPGSEFLNYGIDNQDVQNHALATAAAVAPVGTPENSAAYRKAMVEHAVNFGVREGRDNAEAIAALANTPEFSDINIIQDDPTGGDDTISGPPPGDTGGGTNTFTGNVDFSPVTDLIGTDSGPNRDTIMGRQKIAQDFLEGTIKSGQEGLAAGQADLTKNQLGLMTRIGQPGTDDVLPTGLYKGQQGIRDVVDPLASQVTGLDTKVTGVSDQIGTQAVGDTPATGLFAGQAGLAGQISDVGDTATAVQGLVGAPTEGGPQTLFESQQQLGQRIGTPGEGQTDLFTGQAGLMRGQQNLTTDIGAVSTDLSKEAANIQNQIRGFEQAAQEYQAGATAKRGDIANTAIANQQALMGQIGGVGQTMNQQSEALAKQRQAEAAQFNAAQAPLQQQIANLTSNNQALQNNLQNIGPMGPMAADPRDALIQQLLTRNAALMNNRPV
tara:strand:- start:4073 stop:5407 length:1335 start_codon:yes stop_codon:yes gene_type:complete